MSRLRRIFWRGRMELELDKELRFHFEQAVADAMDAGMSEAAARRAVRLEWGGMEQMKDECREVRRAAWLEDSLADLRVAWRGLRKKPGFAVAAVGALALGIGGNTAIFSVVNAAYFHPLPYRDSDRLVFAARKKSTSWEAVPAAEFTAWKRADVFEALIGFFPGNFTNLTPPGRLAEPVYHVRVTPDFFSTLGVAPQQGRDFQPDECEPGRTSVAILSDSLWRRSFGASPAAIGATALLDGESYRIVGVLPPGFSFPGFDTPEIYLPLTLPAATVASNWGSYLSVIGRLPRGMAVEQAQSRLESATRQLDAAFPGLLHHDPGANWVLTIPLRTRLAGDSRPALAVMMGAAICMLLIACANVANLFLVRGMARAQEVALRAALGASRSRLLRLLIAESLLVTAAGGLLAVALACLAAPQLQFLLPRTIPQASPLDWRTLAFTAGCVAGAAILVAGVPAFRVWKLDLGEVMKAGGVPALARPSRLRGLLAIAQLALSLALLAGAGLMLRSFVKLVGVDMGFDPGDLLTAAAPLRPYKSDVPRRSAEYYRRALAAVSALPGVEAAGLANQAPVTGYRQYVDIGMRSAMSASPGTTIYATSASPGYFRALRIPLLAGRSFLDGDGPGTPPVAIVSLSAARLLFGSANPVGQRITKPLARRVEGQPEAWLTVVGVVADVRHFGYQAQSSPEVYAPFEQWPLTDMNIVVRGRDHSVALESQVRDEMQALDPLHRAPAAKAMDVVLADSIAPRRQRTYLLGALAALSLLVATVGVYGVVSYSVARRTHEIGVRMTLGAQPRDVLRMVLGEGFRLALAGCAIGLVLALWLSRALSGFLFGIGPWDAVSFLMAGGTLAAAVCIASYVPAWQATRVDPAAALRRD